MGKAERNYWPGQASAADRRAARLNIVLENVGITEATQQRYFVAVSRMAHLLKEVTTEASLDDLVATWIQEEFEDGTPLYLVGDALSGIHHYEPYTKKHLPKKLETLLNLAQVRSSLSSTSLDPGYRFGCGRLVFTPCRNDNVWTAAFGISCPFKNRRAAGCATL